MSIEDAMKMIFSGGLIVPETAKQPESTTSLVTQPQGDALYANMPTADDTNTAYIPVLQPTDSSDTSHWKVWLSTAKQKVTNQSWLQKLSRRKAG
jgi:hypothetical protein